MRIETPAPDELVQAVHDGTRKYVPTNSISKPVCERVLDAVPDGWARIDGEWRKCGSQRVLPNGDRAYEWWV